MGNYKKCPRCDMNWILEDEELCDVCKAELGYESKIKLINDEDYLDEGTKLCPICGLNIIDANEDMCEECRATQDDYKKTKITNDNDSSDSPEIPNFESENEEHSEINDEDGEIVEVTPFDELASVDEEMGDDDYNGPTLHDIDEEDESEEEEEDLDDIDEYAFSTATDDLDDMDEELTDEEDDDTRLK